MNCFFSQLRLLILGVWLCAGNAQVRADDAGGVVIESVTVGLGNVARVGAWTPLRVVVKSEKNHTCRVECATPDPSGNPAVVSQNVSLEAGKTAVVELVCIPGRLVTGFTVRVVSDDGAELASETVDSRESDSVEPAGSGCIIQRHDVPMWLIVGDVPALRQRPRTSNASRSAPESADFRVIESNGYTSVVESKLSDSFNVVLNREPSSEVVIQVKVADKTAVQVGSNGLRFTKENWDKPQTVVVSATDDDRMDGSQQSVITLSKVGGDDTASSGDLQRIFVVTQDDEIGTVDQVLTASEFPSTWKHIASYQLIVLSGEFELSEEQAAALQSWTLRGGHLIVAIGSRVDAFESSRLAKWLSKIEVSEAQRLTEVGAFEAFVSSNSRIPPSKCTGCLVHVQDSSILVRNLDGNLAARTAMGLGRVTVCGIDFDKPPFSNWRASPQLVFKLADFRSETETTSNQSKRFSRSGITELQSQLQTGLEAGDEQSGRSTLLILGLILLYLIVIGPGDYALVHRLFKSPSKTWYTFPGLVILIAFAANITANSRNGSDVSTRQIELIDIDTQSGFVREKTWFTVYSPTNRRYKISVDHAPSVLPAKDVTELQADGVRWVGLPESSFGGMYRQSGLELGKPSYLFATDYSFVADMPIPVASNRVLESEAVCQVTGKIVESTLKRAANGQLAYSSVLTHHLSVPIDNWLIVYGSRVYYYDHLAATELKLPAEHSAIKPEVELEIDGPTVESEQLSTFMTGTTRYRVEGKNPTDHEIIHEQTKYNPRSTEILPIIRMLSLHDETGGQEYTSLMNHSLAEFELSRSLSLDRAIIIGTINTPSTKLNINDSEVAPALRQSFVRIVIPVLEKEKIQRTLRSRE
jgi:hypothetical protein